MPSGILLFNYFIQNDNAKSNGFACNCLHHTYVVTEQFITYNRHFQHILKNGRKTWMVTFLKMPH